MTESLQFDLVSPEGRMCALEAVMVQIPGMDGDLTAMADHAPLIAGMRPGILRVVEKSGNVSEYILSGGFAEIQAKAVTVLAERVVEKSNADVTFLDDLYKEAETLYANTKGDDVARALVELSMHDIKRLREQI